MSTEDSTQPTAAAESAANLKSDGPSQQTKAPTPKAAGASVSANPSSPSPTSTASASTNFSDSATSAPTSIPPPPAKEARPAADGHPKSAAKQKGEKRAAPKSQNSASSHSNSDGVDGDISMSNPGLNLGGGGGGSKRKRTVAQLKHSQVEQKRRNRMNAHYMELDSLCLQLDPSLTNVKRNRDAVLVNAIRLLKDFQASLNPASSVRNALGMKANGAAAAAAAVAALRDGQTSGSLPSASASAIGQANDTSKLLDQALFQFRNFPNDAATLLALQQDPLRAQNLAAAAAALSGRPADRLAADNTHDRLSQALGAYYNSSFLGGQPHLLSSLQQSGMNLHHLGSTPSPLPPDYMSLHMLSNNSLPGLSAIDRLTGQPNADLNLLRSLANNQSSSSLASMAASMASGNFFPQAPPPPPGPAPAQNSSSQFMLQ